MLWQMADEPVLCFDGDEAGTEGGVPGDRPGAAASEARQERALRASARGRRPGRPDPQGGAGRLSATRSRRRSRWWRCSGCAAPMGRIWRRRSAAPGSSRPCGPRSPPSAIPMSAGTTKSPSGIRSTAISARNGGRRSAGPPAGTCAETAAGESSRSRPGPPPACFRRRLCAEGAGPAAGLTLSDAVLLGVLAASSGNRRRAARSAGRGPVCRGAVSAPWPRK